MTKWEKTVEDGIRNWTRRYLIICTLEYRLKGYTTAAREVANRVYRIFIKSGLKGLRETYKNHKFYTDIILGTLSDGCLNFYDYVKKEYHRRLVENTQKKIRTGSKLICCYTDSSCKTISREACRVFVSKGLDGLKRHYYYWVTTNILAIKIINRFLNERGKYAKI